MYHESNSELSEEMAKTVAVLSYFTFVGWFIAMLIYGKHHSCYARFHLCQSFGLLLAFAIASLLPLIGWLFCMLLVPLWGYALLQAIAGHKYCVPVLGDIAQQQFNFIR